MSKKILTISFLFCIILTILFGFFFMQESKQTDKQKQGLQIVALNEAEMLLNKAIESEEYSSLPAINAMIEQQKEELEQNYTVAGVNNKGIVIALYIGCLLFVAAIFGYIYYAILRPFNKMKQFAKEIAAGNLDIRLGYERSNYFGEFTWAFDSMRREITRARELEKEAVENNKVVIATLSHDIKTPIASIRAYTEGLESNLDDEQNRALFLDVIIRKCDEVSKLTNDLFIHSISDLNKLLIEPEITEITGLVKGTVDELSAEKSDISYLCKEEQIDAYIDSKRLIQVIENVISNARKYARAPIQVLLEKKNNTALLTIRDHGNGVPDEDMPFLFEKFYRGRNIAEQPGSGLGLYIVKYVMQQCKGDVSLYNHSDGLEVVIEISLNP